MVPIGSVNVKSVALSFVKAKMAAAKSIFFLYDIK